MEIFDGLSWNSICGAPTLCEFSATPSTGELFIDKGQTGSFDVDFGVVGGIPGDIFTLMDNPTSVPGLTLTSVTNQSSDAPVTQTINLQVAATAPVGDYTLRFRFIAECGVERVQLITLHVTGCDFGLSINEEVLNAQPQNITLSTQLNIQSLGTESGSITTNIVGSYPNITPSVTNNGCFMSCVQTVQFQIDTATIAGSYNYTIEVASSCGTSKSIPITVEIGSFRSCKQILDAGYSNGDGVYTIDPDGGQGPIGPTACYCDMTTDGGGWTLVLNYFRANSTNPDLNVLTAGFPLPTIFDAQQTFPGQFMPLGYNEATNNPAGWGHCGTDVLLFMPISDVRFYGRTDRHTRIMHFKTDLQALIEYFKTGSGSVPRGTNGLNNNYTPLANHSSILPGAHVSSANDAGNFAMTRLPMKSNGSNWHWDLKIGNSWRMDDHPNGSSGSTIHQVWVR